MTFNKYFVFVPKALEQDGQQMNEWTSDKETQRQAMVEQAQQQGSC
ncbi:hypothetical protein ACXHQT_03595 [Vibrio cincinnatiensis]